MEYSRDGCDYIQFFGRSPAVKEFIDTCGCASHSTAKSEREIREDERERVLATLDKWIALHVSRYNSLDAFQTYIRKRIAELRKQGGEQK
jgi:hypothetical protein